MVDNVDMERNSTTQNPADREQALPPRITRRPTGWVIEIVDNGNPARRSVVGTYETREAAERALREGYGK